MQQGTAVTTRHAQTAAASRCRNVTCNTAALATHAVCMHNNTAAVDVVNYCCIGCSNASVSRNSSCTLCACNSAPLLHCSSAAAAGWLHRTGSRTLALPAVLLYMASMASAPKAFAMRGAAASRRGKLRQAALNAAMSDSSCMHRRVYRQAK